MAFTAIAAEHAHGLIPPGSKIYVDSNNGFDIFIDAALKGKTDLQLVTRPEDADYILDSSVFHSGEFVATQKVAVAYRTSEAAFKLTSRDGNIVWAYAVTKGLMGRGKQSVAEACAKHLNEAVIRQKHGQIASRISKVTP